MRAAAGLFSRYLHSTRTTSFFPRCDGYSANISRMAFDFVDAGGDINRGTKAIGEASTVVWSDLEFGDAIDHRIAPPSVGVLSRQSSVMAWSRLFRVVNRGMIWWYPGRSIPRSAWSRLA